MNVIFVYGPPASGKLTVAQELSKLISYPLFHNHLTRDLVQSIYPGKLKENYELVDTLRIEVLKYCALHDTNIIFTFVYDGPEDDKVVSDKVRVIYENGGDVLFVELKAPHDILLERVTNESRKQHKKIVDRDALAVLLNEVPYPPLPYDNILTIDTSKQEPSKTAELIARHFNLTN